MGDWIRGISIVGGRLFGETAPCADSFAGYTVGDNDTIGWNGTGDDPKTADLNEFFLDIPVNSGVNERATIAVLQGTDEYPLNKIVIEMQLRSEQAWGRARLGVTQYVGYYNDSQQFVEMFSCSNSNYSDEGVSSYTDLSLRLHLCMYEQNGRKVLGVANSIKSDSRDCYTIAGSLSSVNFIQTYLPSASDLPISSPEFGKPASKKGGYVWRKTGRKPTFDDHSDTITVSSAPVLSPTSSGFFHQYYVTAADLVGFADAMFVDPTNAPDLLSAVGELCEVLYARNRMSSVLDLLIIPVTPSYGSSETITAGGRRLTYSDEQGQMRSVTGCPISNPYVDFPCGSITVPEYWANFLDFSGTKFKLFLPYVGYVDIQPEFVNGGTLWVDYRFNTIDGSFMAYVHSTSTHSELTRSLVGQYAGIAALHIPLQGNDYSQKLAGLISAAGTVALAPAGAAAGPSLAAAATSLVNTAVAKPGTTHGNGYNASSSYLSHRKPYLIVERQIAQFSELYPHEDGLPLYVNDTIGNCKGFTKATKAHLEPIPAPAAIKERIKELLAEGIIVNSVV
ncbi:MAG: hypothetical protein J6Q39_07145 [Bacteroidales bacterium]|nr:hypothetical protein [Bacteroidales bacterium]